MKSIVVDLARTRGLRNVWFHPQVPLESIPSVLAASDALFVPLSGHPTFEQFAPSKLIECMCVGRPVVLSAAGEAARILQRAGSETPSRRKRRASSRRRSGGSRIIPRKRRR
jgi:glycosyltransferase involved in cell wall biosynthesis